MTMRPVSCSSCARTVLVEKFSAVHTSIQWTDDAQQCPQMRATHECGGVAFGARSRGCAELRASIDQAVADHVIGESQIELPVGAQIPRLH